LLPISVRLKHFIGIKDGLNRDELYLNFEELVGDAKLIAVIGHNGAGKTTVIDNMQPYRIMPSKVKNYSPGSFSYYDETIGNAEKEFVFSDNGVLYRSSIVIKGANRTKKTESYLFYQDAEGNWEPFTAENGLVSDGKSTTYDACINSLLGTPEMFFTSQFAAQGRPAISTYDNGDIKSLMSELLNMNQVVELGQKAGTVKKGLQMKLSLMQSDLSAAAENESKKSALTNTVNDAERMLDKAKLDQPIARNKVQAATRRVADLQAENNQNTEVEIRRNDLDSRKIFTEKQLKDKFSEVDSDIHSLRNRSENEKDQKAKAIKGLASQIASYKTQSSSYDQQIAGYSQQIKRQQDLICKKPVIISAQQKSPGLNEALADLIKEREKLRSDVIKIQALFDQRSELAVKAQKLASEGTSKTEQLKDYELRAQLCSEVPCQGSDMQINCKLLENAIKAKDQCVAVNAELNKARTEYEAFAKDIKAITGEIAALGNPQEQLTRLQKQIDTAQSDIDENNKITALTESLNDATDVIEHNESLIVKAQESQASIKDLINTANSSIKEIEIQINQLVISEGEAKKALDQRKVDAQIIRDNAISSIETELKRLPPPVEASGLEQAEKELSSADTELASLDLFIEKQNNIIATAKAELDQVILALYGAKKLKALGTKLEDEIAIWTQLQTALGIDGIIALSIDDAGPTLASYTNELLVSCYGHRFSVRIDTQKTLKSGLKKEVFEITVFDSESDSEKNIACMSGGQRVWINEAITRAIALYQASLSPIKLKTLFSDELDGALDPDNKLAFFNMKRKVLEIGDYDKEFFISHTPELWQMADAVIDISAYKQ